MGRQLHLKHCNGCNYVSMVGSKLTHVYKTGPCPHGKDSRDGK